MGVAIRCGRSSTTGRRAADRELDRGRDARRRAPTVAVARSQRAPARAVDRGAARAEREPDRAVLAQARVAPDPARPAPACGPASGRAGRAARSAALARDAARGGSRASGGPRSRRGARRTRRAGRRPGQVDEHGAVGGLDLVPALATVLQRLAQRPRARRREPQGEHLPAAVEAERGAARADGGDVSGSLMREPPQAGRSRSGRRRRRRDAGTRPASRGCPCAAASSISRSPRSRSSASVSVDVLDRVGDVVQARAALGQEAADRRVVGERRQQLDVALADVEQRGLDALLCDRLAVHERHAVGVARGARSPPRGRRPRRRCGRCGRTRRRVYLQRAMRIALAANRASGGGLDPDSAASPPCARPARRSFGGCEADEIEALAATRPTGSPSRAGTGRSARSPSWRGGSACRWR